MYDFVRELGIEEVNSGVCHGDWIKNPGGEKLISYSPIDGKPIAAVITASENDYEEVMERASDAFKEWRKVPAPKRGEIARQIGLELRKYKKPLGALVTLEMGKIIAEGDGEVQEMIDIADFSVGLSRQLYGLSMHSERPDHRMFEQWHPLGVIGIISAFNFPVAVWSWNSMIAAVCGDTMVWKPSSETPLTAIAVQNIVNRVLSANGLSGIMNLCIGPGRTVGERLVNDARMELVSATGSTKMGIRIGEAVGRRLGRTILELGGNNGIIIMEDADPELTLRAVLFGAVGTAGQRCTTTRRLIIQKNVAGEFVERLKTAYSQIPIGNPLESQTLMGPLVNTGAVEEMTAALKIIEDQGGEVVYGGKRLEGSEYPGGCYVEPAIVIGNPGMPIIKVETFAPILYVMTFDEPEEAIAIHNDVPQGLSSAMFTASLANAETFLSNRGSDCGIANINIGTSGAEIGGAFGGEKETGGGREAGSDSWKAYMRRQTVTVNWSNDLPLAQGIEFG